MTRTRQQFLARGALFSLRPGARGSPQALFKSWNGERGSLQAREQVGLASCVFPRHGPLWAFPKTAKFAREFPSGARTVLQVFNSLSLALLNLNSGLHPHLLSSGWIFHSPSTKTLSQMTVMTPTELKIMTETGALVQLKDT